MEPIAGTSELRLLAVLLVTVLVAAGAAIGTLGRERWVLRVAWPPVPWRIE